MILTVLTSCSGSNKGEIWLEGYELTAYIPEFEKEPDYITEDETRLELDYTEVSDESFSSYVEKCKEYGYTTEPSENDNQYSAYNEDGYRLSLFVYEGEMSLIVVDRPTFSKITWPDEGLASLIPKPYSDTGTILEDSDTRFAARIAETTLGVYSEYVKDIYNAGFDVDMTKATKGFAAQDANGNRVLCEYSGNNIILIEIISPEYFSSTETDQN